MEKKLLGRPVAEAIRERMLPLVQALADSGAAATLCIVRVGEQPGALAYERSARKTCEVLGICVRERALPEQSSTAELLELLDEVNTDPTIHGCLLLRPLPKHMDENAACEYIVPEKDVDGVTSRSVSRVFSGVKEGFPPCTAQACLEMLDYYGVPLAGADAVVIGRSLVVGRPVAALLTGRDATVTICHRKTRGLAAKCRRADILIVAAGCMGMVDASFAREGQIVLDVGTNADENGRLRGDVAFDEVSAVAAAVSPVPGGVGAVTTMVLAKHVIEAALRQQNES